MTLGLTSTGAVKIKVEDGTTTAVNCACCTPCAVCQTTISGDLLETMRKATTGTCNGASPKAFNANGGGFSAVWEFGVSPNSTFYTCALAANANCFSFGGSNGDNEIRSGSSVECCPTYLPFPVTCANVTYEINGEPFVAHTENYGFGSNVPSPTFIFS